MVVLKQVIIVAVILVLIAFSIPALLMIHGDIQTIAASDFNISEFSPLILLNIVDIDSKINFIPFSYTNH